MAPEDEYPRPPPDPPPMPADPTPERVAAHLAAIDEWGDLCASHVAAVHAWYTAHPPSTTG